MIPSSDSPRPAPPRRSPSPRHGARAAALVLLLVGAAAVACDREAATGAAPALTRDEFAAVIVELREAEREALQTDSVGVVFGRRKAEILERHGTTEEELRAFVDAASRDVRRLAELWEEISDRLRQPAPTDSL